MSGTAPSAPEAPSWRDPDVRAHVLNGKNREDRFGPRIGKDPDHADKRIDAAIASIIAYDMAIRGEDDEEPSIWLA